MLDPVLLSDGFSYERVAIERWLLHKNTSPCTGGTLRSTLLVPNHTLRSMIREVIAERTTPVDEHHQDLNTYNVDVDDAPHTKH